MVHLDPAVIVGFQPGGAAAAVIGVVVGYGANYLSAVSIEDRLVLVNGSHRAYALRSAGVTHAPCLIQTLTRRDELDVVGVQELNEKPDAFLADPRPPLLKDYFDPQLRMIVHVPSKNRQVRVVLQSEQVDVPAS
jgi:hypothetical protein